VSTERPIRLPWSERTHYLVVSAPGYQTEARELRADTSYELDIQLAKKGEGITTSEQPALPSARGPSRVGSARRPAAGAGERPAERTPVRGKERPSRGDQQEELPPETQWEDEEAP
jgi:hypothetical protein